MRRMIIAAAVLLGIQIALVVALNVTHTGQQAASPATPLLGFAPDSVNVLEITGPEGKRLVLRKNETGWILPDSFAAPAGVEQISALLAKLAGLQQGFVVAASEEAAKRFKVADALFERHVVLKDGDRVVGDFYVGTSPGFRQVHARKAGTGDIVIVALSNFDLETGADKWLDKNIFKQKAEDIASLAFTGFTLHKKDDGWQLADLVEGEQTDKEAAEGLVNGVTGLTIQDVLNPQDGAALFNGEPALVYTVAMKDGSKSEYRFAKPEADYFVVQQTGRELYGKVHTIQVENLRKLAREKLVKQAENPKVEEEAVEK